MIDENGDDNDITATALNSGSEACASLLATTNASIEAPTIENENGHGREEDDAIVRKEEENKWKDADFLTFDNGKDDDKKVTNSKSVKSSPTTFPTNKTYQSSFDQSRAKELESKEPLPPWMDLDDNCVDSYQNINQNHHHLNRNKFIPKLVKLHDEIVQFVELMKPTKDEMNERKNLTKEIESVIRGAFCRSVGSGEKVSNNYGVHINVFGSQSTGLLLPSSDIDLVVTLDKNDKRWKGHVKEEKKEGRNKDDNEGKEDDEENTRKKEKCELDEYNRSTADGGSFLSFSSPLVHVADALRSHFGDIDDEDTAEYIDGDNSSGKGIENKESRSKKRGVEYLSYLEVIEETRVPIVKFTHQPSNLSVDICFDQTAGVHAAQLVSRFMDAMPPFEPLTFVLKYFLASRSLNAPYSGGIGSFALQMMIVSFLQHRARDLYNAEQSHRRHHGGRGDIHSSSHNNLGSLLLEFFELYGMDFNYVTTGISVRFDGYYFPKGSRGRRDDFYHHGKPLSLAIEDPLNPTNDITCGSFRIGMIQRSFETAFRILLSRVAEPSVSCTSILASVLPPTEEMIKRGVLIKITKRSKRKEVGGSHANASLSDPRIKRQRRGVESK